MEAWWQQSLPGPGPSLTPTGSVALDARVHTESNCESAMTLVMCLWLGNCAVVPASNSRMPSGWTFGSPGPRKLIIEIVCHR
jgi:hypothetical protein